MPLLGIHPSVLTPERAFRTGVVLVVVSVVLEGALVPTLYAVGGQPLASNEVAWTLVRVVSTVLLPLGAAFVVLSLIGRALEPVKPTGDADADADGTTRGRAA